MTVALASVVREWLIARVAERSGLDPRAIDSHQYVAGEGGSAPAVRVAGHGVASAVSESEPIAIIGLACHVPQAGEGRDAMAEVLRDRWDGEAWFDADRSAPGKPATRRGGFIGQVDQFDALFFGVSPREAAHTDAQQRLALELCREALENAGIRPEDLRGTPSGVFFGVTWGDYGTLLCGAGGRRLGPHSVVGLRPSIVARQVARVLDLRGPSMALDTACSSSLVGIHQACASLRRGTSTLALAGGVNLDLAPESAVGLSKFGALSPDRHGFALGARAKGHVRGEGGGVVVLKRLSRALADGDRVECVILGGVVDSACNGLTAPSPKARAPRGAHAPLVIGSIRNKIGHLEAAAGLAALIKVMLAIRHGAIPPSLHFESPNPHIPCHDLRPEVARTQPPRLCPDEPPATSVSVFGLGGTHCSFGPRQATASPELLPFAAAEAFRAAAAACHTPAVAPAGTSLAEQVRSWVAAHAPHRLAVCARTRADLARAVEWFARAEARPELAPRSGPAQPAPVFVFSGMGSQWPGMGVSLLRNEPVFRAQIEECDDHIGRHLGWSLVELLTDGDERRLAQVDVACPAIVAIEIALAALWRSWGVEPAAVVGHSVGETAAACVAGVLSVAEAMLVICSQARLLRAFEGLGGMGLVGLGWSEAAETLRGREGRVFRAIEATPGSTVLAGEPAALDEVLTELAARRIFCRRIKAGVAAHSPLLAGLAGELRAALSAIEPRASRTPIVSPSPSGAGGRLFDAAHWVRNLCEPIRFSSTITSLAADGHQTFLEVSPHPIVSHALAAHLRVGGRVLPSCRGGEDERSVLLATLGRLLFRSTSARP